MHIACFSLHWSYGKTSCNEVALSALHWSDEKVYTYRLQFDLSFVFFLVRKDFLS